MAVWALTDCVLKLCFKHRAISLMHKDVAYIVSTSLSSKLDIKLKVDWLLAVSQNKNRQIGNMTLFGPFSGTPIFVKIRFIA